MRRREFITGFAGVVATPFAVRAQERMRRVAVLMNLAADDPLYTSRLLAFGQGLQQAGWIVGTNLRIEVRSSEGDADRLQKIAAELVALAPDVILSPGSVMTAPLLQVTRTIPIVFVHVPDPVGAGFADSLARPGGNATGFALSEYNTSAKWLELLKQIAPSMTRAAIIRDPDITAGIGQWGAIQTAAPSLGIEVSPINVRDAAEIERAVAAFARSPNGGLVVTAGGRAVIQREVIIRLATRHKLPSIFFERFFVAAGGLASYGPDIIDQFRRSAAYIDRILKGEKPADLPVQAPIKYEMAINLRTAKALGLTVPPSLIATADEVIE